MRRSIEASISVVVSSMPSAAKIWNRHIVPSTIYKFLRSKLPTADSEMSTASDIPSDIKNARAEIEKKKKRRRGLWSLPTFLTGTFVTTQASEKRDNLTIDTFRASVDRRLEGPGRFSLELNDPSGYTNGPNVV